MQLSIEEDSLDTVVAEKDDATALPMEPEETELPVTDLPNKEDELPVSSSSQTEDALISRLSQGMDSRYGAALILTPFLQKLELIPILAQSVLAQKDACADKARTVADNLQELLNPERLYNLAQMFLTLVYLDCIPVSLDRSLQVSGPEGLWPVARGFEGTGRKDPAALLGGGCRPGDIWRCSHEASPAVLEAGHIVQLGSLYLDGNFVPNYGKSHIAKGYFTTRRLALKGNHPYFANEPKGRPIFFRLTSAAVKFTDIIPDMVKDAQELMAETGTQSPLIVVFDRGGYDSKLFQKLDRMGVLYIT
ncbi:hypothetical protein JCM15765_37920 [Paradesulfitobacterium aromaticivorans]